MPKTKIAKLVQSPIDQAVIVDLEANEKAILTGVMGGCCSIVVLWGKNIDGSGYQNVRGHHAGGGPGNLNWDLLLKGVKSGASTKVVMSCAKNDYTNYTQKVKVALTENNMQCRKAFYLFSNAYIDRNGDASNFNDMKSASYTIRNENARFII